MQPDLLRDQAISSPDPITEKVSVLSIPERQSHCPALVLELSCVPVVFIFFFTLHWILGTA